jgi:hypothetical protein
MAPEVARQIEGSRQNHESFVDGLSIELQAGFPGAVEQNAKFKQSSLLVHQVL